MNQPTNETRTTPTEKMAYSTRELAESLDISELTVWRLGKRGLLTPIPGLKGRWTVSSVSRLCNAEVQQ
jgi:hypothetical protein